MATDWQGKTYDVGDIVVYPRQVGYAVEMVEARVLEIKSPTNVRVQPLRSSRSNFGQDGDRTRFHWAYGDKPVTLTKGVASITVLGEDEALLGLATTEALLNELAVRMKVTQNSTAGRKLGCLCEEAIEKLDRGVLRYRTIDS